MNRTVCLTILLLTLLPTYAAVAAPHPNVVILYTDDQGTLDAN